MANPPQARLRKWPPTSVGGQQKQIYVLSSDVPDVFGGGGGGYMGDYDPTITYNAGQTVTVPGTTGGYYFGLPPGTAPTKGVMPVFPQPAGNPWKCLGLMFQPIEACSNGPTAIYIQATLPFS